MRARLSEEITASLGQHPPLGSSRRGFKLPEHPSLRCPQAALQPAAELSGAAASTACMETARPSALPSSPSPHRSLARFPPRKPYPLPTFPGLPSAAGPAQHPAPRGARAMTPAAEGDLQIVLGAQGAKDPRSRKLRLFFLSDLPFLIFFFSVSVKEKFPTSSQNH